MLKTSNIVFAVISFAMLMMSALIRSKPMDACRVIQHEAETKDVKRDVCGSYNKRNDIMKDYADKFTNSSCRIPGAICSWIGICSHPPRIDYAKGQLEYDYREECPTDCYVSNDDKCGASNDHQSCPYPGQYCSQSGLCGMTEQFKKDAQINYNFRAFGLEEDLIKYNE